MSARPQFYSGRGAITSDLNDQILEKVYQGIQQGYGNEAAQAFAQMVGDIPKLSATDFLLTLYTLERRGWKWDKKLSGNEKGIYVDGANDGEKMAIGFATIGGVMFGDNSRDETDYIRREFLKRHKIQNSEPARGMGLRY